MFSSFTPNPLSKSPDKVLASTAFAAGADGIVALLPPPILTSDPEVKEPTPI